MDFDLDFTKVDLYELFEILPEATETEIKKAYRKKALIYHPDKNPDNPKANEVFQKLSKALEVLTDKEARASYDKILRAKKERQAKNKKLDAKRRKLRDELDAREKVAQEIIVKNEEEKLRHEIERIRKEGSKQLEEENILLKMKLEEQLINPMPESSFSTETNRVKIRRKVKIDLTESLLRKELSSFGEILFIIIAKNGKSAIVEYANYDSIIHLKDNCPKKFEVEILSKNTKQVEKHKTATNLSKVDEIPMKIEGSHEDYEDFVFRQMLQADANNRSNDE